MRSIRMCTHIKHACPRAVWYWKVVPGRPGHTKSVFLATLAETTEVYLRNGYSFQNHSSVPRAVPFPPQPFLIRHSSFTTLPLGSPCFSLHQLPALTVLLPLLISIHQWLPLALKALHIVSALPCSPCACPSTLRLFPTAYVYACCSELLLAGYLLCSPYNNDTMTIWQHGTCSVEEHACLLAYVHAPPSHIASIHSVAIASHIHVCRILTESMHAGSISLSFI